MGDEFTLKNEDLGIGELRPGSTPRRWEPEEGVGKLNSRIHKESSLVDKYGNMPFTFSKPKKSGKTKLVRCTNCKTIKLVNKNCTSIICSTCNQYAKTEDLSNE